MHGVVIGLGGNVGGEAAVRARFEDARAALASWGAITVAPIYRTAAIGPPQLAFLNSALRIRIAGPDPEPRELIESLLELERMLGRDRGAEVRWGPRPLDLDVLLWDDRVQRVLGPPPLEVPHPRLTQRRFALRPVADLVGFAAIVPGTGHTVEHWLATVADQELELVAQSW